MTLVFAHRGASAAHPENTLAASDAAAAMGADWVELDVRRTACGSVVVHHDPDLSDGRAILGLRLADLPDSVPTLEAALIACGEMGVDIEIKNDPTEADYDDEHSIVEPLVETVRQILPRSRTLISSFDMGAINRVHDIDPNMPTALITDADVGVDVTVGRVVAHGHGAVKPWEKLVTKRWLDAARAAELSVYSWTVDDPDRMRELADLGIDGIVTNTPDVAVGLLR